MFHLSGVHVVQWMYGCEWDEDNGEVKGYYQFGYDGEDFIVLNLKDQSWVAPKQQAVITKHKLDSDKAQLVYLKDYFTNICPEGLKKYLNYGRSYLMRTGKLTRTFQCFGNLFLCLDILSYSIIKKNVIFCCFPLFFTFFYQLSITVIYVYYFPFCSFKLSISCVSVSPFRVSFCLFPTSFSHTLFLSSFM